MPREIDFMMFNRDELDKVAVIYPEGHDKYPGGRKMTMREVIQESLDKHGSFFGRKDIGMVNLTEWGARGNKVIQHIIDPTPSGEPNWHDTKQFLTTREIKELRALNKRLLVVEKEAGWPLGTLSGGF